MSQVSERRRKPRQRNAASLEPSWVTLLNVPGASAEVRAKVVDVSELGIGVETTVELPENQVIGVHGLPGRGPLEGDLRARVVRCSSDSNGGYRAGLNYEDGGGPSAKPAAAVPDYYEVLQISQNADPDMIHRVFRLLAQRFHPDNGETGDEKSFREVAEAYKILSDAEKRAAYDVNLHAHRQVRWKIFDQRQAAVGKLAEKSKRRGVLELLYAARRDDSRQPSMTLHEIEDLLGCPREHLEFSLWYLKENGLVVRGDNGRLMITAKGVDFAEQEEMERLREDRLLPAVRTPADRPQ
jgi:hypothetical protein